MSKSRMIPLDKINKMIDEKVKEYENSAEECYQEIEDPDAGREYDAKAAALNDFKIDINDPESIEDVSENIDQTIHVEGAKKIIKDGL